MYYLEVFFMDNNSIAIKSLIKYPTIEEVDAFLSPKDKEKFGPIKKIHVIPRAEVEKFFDWRNIDNWPVLTKNEEIFIQGNKVKCNYDDTGEKIKYGMDIQMGNDGLYYGVVYYFNSERKVTFECYRKYKSFSKACDDLSLAIIQHMNEHPIIHMG